MVVPTQLVIPATLFLARLEIPASAFLAKLVLPPSTLSAKEHRSHDRKYSPERALMVVRTQLVILATPFLARLEIPASAFLAKLVAPSSTILAKEHRHLRSRYPQARAQLALRLQPALLMLVAFVGWVMAIERQRRDPRCSMHANRHCHSCPHLDHRPRRRKRAQPALRLAPVPVTLALLRSVPFVVEILAMESHRRAPRCRMHARRHRHDSPHLAFDRPMLHDRRRRHRHCQRQCALCGAVAYESVPRPESLSYLWGNPQY